MLKGGRVINKKPNIKRLNDATILLNKTPFKGMNMVLDTPPNYYFFFIETLNNQLNS